jgi:hypothetical protein
MFAKHSLFVTKEVRVEAKALVVQTYSPSIFPNMSLCCTLSSFVLSIHKWAHVFLCHILCCNCSGNHQLNDLNTLGCKIEDNKIIQTLFYIVGYPLKPNVESPNFKKLMNLEIW